MAELMSRRKPLGLGAAGVAAAVPRVSGGAASAPSQPVGGLSRVFEVASFGATGDRQTIDTDAINAAIETATSRATRRDRGGPRPGGTVYFPAGTYASYSIRLKSNVAMHLAEGATVRGGAGIVGFDGREQPPPDTWPSAPAACSAPPCLPSRSASRARSARPATARTASVSSSSAAARRTSRSTRSPTSAPRTTSRRRDGNPAANVDDYRAVVAVHSADDVLDGAQQSALQAFIQGGGGFVGVGEAAEFELGVGLRLVGDPARA
jgi:hypothetical protein